MAEAALVLVVLILVTLGAVEYGWLFLNAQQITNAARQGARVAILPDAGAEARAYAVIDTLLANMGLNDDSPTRTITYGAIPGDPEGRQEAIVRVSVSTDKLRILKATFLPAPATLGAMVTMAKEGP